jgi:hypothetical protein
LGATFGSGLTALLSVLGAALAGAGLLALVLLTLLASVLAVVLPLGWGFAGALAALRVDLGGVFGIGLEGVLVGALATGLVAGLDTTFALGWLPGVLAGLALVLPGLELFSAGLVVSLGRDLVGLPWAAPLAVDLRVAFCWMPALRTDWFLLGGWVFEGVLAWGL